MSGPKLGGSVTRFSPFVLMNPVLLLGLLAALQATACSSTPPSAAGPSIKDERRRVTLTQLATTPKVGEPVARLQVAGQPDVVVPMWVSLGDEQCDIVSVSATTLPSGLVLVKQDTDPNCHGSTCRMWQPNTGGWLDASCPSLTGGRTSITHLRGDLYLLIGYQEGPASVEVVRWGAGDNYVSVLDNITDDVHVDDKGRLIVSSACNPSTGRAVGLYAPDTACSPMNAGCGYCEGMYGIPVRWHWEPGAPARRITP